MLMTTAVDRPPPGYADPRDGRVITKGRPMRDGALLYAETRLAAWAKWAKEHRHGLGFPTISLLYKAMRQRATQVKRTEANTLTARGTETHSMVEAKVGEPPNAITEVDKAVASLPQDLHTVIIADYFTYGPIEVRARETRWKRARYSQLLECAKYAVFARLSVIEKGT